MRHNLAHWTGESGDAGTARALLESLAADCTRILGAEHPDTENARRALDWWTWGPKAGARPQDPKKAKKAA
ncbi:tetratricopeptide repeat protein [Yinghuangia sp. KLBMP8922]|uniref:Tetratricopeptide repeat protein n=2 Tax=Yinghuangia soli TaxID=2908204 RepID=A0AA41Q6Q0_9ACTN|nr:tetratricopeptide repeat protein [Yinghuangia soli]